MDKDLKKVVVLLAHPNMENSQANKALLDAIKDIEDVAIFNLYEMLEQAGLYLMPMQWYISFHFIGCRHHLY